MNRARKQRNTKLAKRAIAIKPDYVDAHSNVGIIIKTLGKPSNAILHHKEAIAIAPDNCGDNYVNLGRALLAMGQHVDGLMYQQKGEGVVVF